MVADVTTTSPVQYCGLGEPITLLHKALQRARHIAHSSQIVVTVSEENRQRWEPALWFISPERRFISHTRTTASLTMAAALLSIAADSASNVVTILPARCYVAHEGILAAALHELNATLPRIPERVGTLGMIDIDEGLDEDYLVPGANKIGPGLAVQAMARQPARWVAQHLRQHGAMIASGILTGYAGTFATHISKQCPELAKALMKMKRVAPGGESQFSTEIYRAAPKSALRSLRWWPPTFPQRALAVYRCGWRGLHTARAVARISASFPANVDSAPQPIAEPTSQRISRESIVGRYIDHGWVD